MHDISDDLETKGWQDLANCLGVDPDLFFPERGASTREAKEVCKGCVVRGDCLEYALANPEPDSYYYQLLTAVKLERVAPEVFDFLRPAHARKVAAKASWIAAVSEARSRFGREAAHTAALSLS